MENNEIVRSLKFYCDAIFKYDYEKDKVFLYYDSNRPEYANNWFDTERIIEHYTSSYVFAADVHQASGNLASRCAASARGRNAAAHLSIR